MAEHKLIVIPPCDWMKLRDKYLIDWPKNAHGYYTLDNFIRWYNRLPTIKHLQIFCLDGDWSDGTFILEDRYELFINSLEDMGVERLRIGLALLDWSKGYKVSSFLARHRPAVQHSVESNRCEREFDSLTLLYYFERANADKLKICPPDGITLKPLSNEHADFVNELWPNHHIGSQFLVRRWIDWNYSMGAFTEDGQLVSWCLRHQNGALGSLQTVTSHLGKGLAKLVTTAIVKRLAEHGEDAHALVNPDNTPSRKVFESVGFEVIDQAYWLRTKPTNNKPYTWSDD